MMEAMEKMMMLKGFEALMSEVAAMPASGFTLGKSDRLGHGRPGLRSGD
jgi:hypothetical protein